MTTPIIAHAFRLGPGEDLLSALDAYVTSQNLEAALVLSVVGSLERVHLRLADQPEGTVFVGKHEIVSLVGTMSCSGGSHLHLSIADKNGNVIGGHLLLGNLVYTTAEIVLGALPALVFSRAPDPRTGYDELLISRPSKS